MQIHIGQVIKKALKRSDMDVSEFASKINYTRSNAYKIFNKQTIDTGLLIKINEVLGINLFFHFITDEEIMEYRDANGKSPRLKVGLKELKDILIELEEATERKKKNSVVNNKKLVKRNK